MNGRITLNFALALIGIAACVGFFLLLPRLAQSAPHPSQAGSFLAGVGLNAPHQSAVLLKWYPKHDDCVAEAVKLNQSNERLREPDAREIGAEYVCLRIERGAV